MTVWGYSDLESFLKQVPAAKNGILLDANVLISATYDLDRVHDEAAEFFELLIAKQIPLFVNVTARAEFLEIHRRIIFSEVILDFEREVDKSILPSSLAAKLSQFRNRYERKLKDKPNDPPVRLSEAEIKDFKFEMIQVSSPKGDLWTELCENRVANQLSTIWEEAEEALGLNPLGARGEDKEYLNLAPSWTDAEKLMSKHGLASSDAMILNIFLCSKLEALVSSDFDLGLAVEKEKLANKHCLVPDDVKTKVEFVIK
ncbi:MAG: hypothetical protein JST16_05135 [Bdellovibrionales bacterium]|nr:hypothetical protein [Bdellovibrionales bacterium]